MSDTPMTDEWIQRHINDGVPFGFMDVHARRLENALKVAEQELIAIHNAASTQGLPTFAAKVKDTLSTIAKLKEAA